MSTQNNGTADGTILITGGCGYLGASLIRRLTSHPQFSRHPIRILDNMQRANYQALMNLPGGASVQFIEGDILDPVSVRMVLKDAAFVIHLAAVVNTPMSFDHPAWTGQVNHWGTARLIEECLNGGVERFIFTSSAAVYGPGGPFSESDTLRPVGPYAQSKQNAEQAVAVAADRGLKPTILRLGTLYGAGPAMRFEAFVNRFVYLAAIGQPLIIFGDGSQTRPIIHVEDACEAVLFSLSHSEETVYKTFNVATLNASVQAVADAIRQARPEVSLRYTDQDALTHLSFEIVTDAFEQAGFEPQVALQPAVSEMLGRMAGLEALPVMRPED